MTRLLGDLKNDFRNKSVGNRGKLFDLASITIMTLIVNPWSGILEKKVLKITADIWGNFFNLSWNQF